MSTLQIWNSTTYYPVGSTVIGSDGNIYKANGGNSNQNPISNPVYWDQESSQTVVPIAVTEASALPLSFLDGRYATTSLSGQKIYTSPAAPSSPNVGDIWIPTTAATPGNFGGLAINDPYLAYAETGAMIEPYPIQWAQGSITFASGYLFLVIFTARFSLTVGHFLNDGVRASVGQTLAQQGLYTYSATNGLTLVARTPAATNVFSGSYSEVSTAFDATLNATYNIVAGQQYALAAINLGASTYAQVAGLYAPSLGRSGMAGLVTGQTSMPTSISNGSLGTAQSAPWLGLIA